VEAATKVDSKVVRSVVWRVETSVENLVDSTAAWKAA
jgi:hypothetical protein